MVIIRPTHHKTLSTKNLIKQHEVYLKSKKSIHTHIDINKADLYYDNNLHSIVNSLYRINRMVLSCSKRTYWIGLEQILDNNNNRFKIPTYNRETVLGCFSLHIFDMGYTSVQRRSADSAEQTPRQKRLTSQYMY